MLARHASLTGALLLAACSQGAPGAPPPDGTGGETEASGGGGGKPASGGRGGGSGGTGGATTPDASASDLAIAPPPDAEASADTGAPDTAPASLPWSCPSGPFEAPKPGPSQAICGDFHIKYSWNEGPAWVPSQKAFFFSNFVIMESGPGDMIKYDPATGNCETFIEGNGCNGLTVDRDGNLLAACQTPRAVLKYDLTTKKSMVLVDMVEGKQLDSPNDLVAHANGTIYFTNPTFELGGRPPGYGSSVWRLDPMGVVHLIARGGVNPIALSPDQKRLYVAGSVWNLDDEGVPTKAGPFTLGGDGIAVDCAGNIYTAGGDIVSPDNKKIGKFPAGTNMAFGGPEMKTLLVVQGKEMHTVQMNLPGLP